MAALVFQMNAQKMVVLVEIYVRYFIDLPSSIFLSGPVKSEIDSGVDAQNRSHQIVSIM